LGIGTVSRLYNLASRLDVAGSQPEDVTPGQRDQIKLDPAETTFTRRADQYLKREFGRRPIEDIAFHLHLSEPAVVFRARTLKLRKPVKFWPLDKVSEWMGMSEDEVAALSEEGLDLFPMAGRDGKKALTVVSTSSLARWMKLKKNLKRLDQLGADKFFIAEIQESVQEIVDKKTGFELCSFLSHGHVCMNPLSQASYGFYCTNNDVYEAGDDPRCHVKIVKVEDLAPEE
jgi:hypothetical protein